MKKNIKTKTKTVKNTCPFIDQIDIGSWNKRHNKQDQHSDSDKNVSVKCQKKRKKKPH